MRILFCNIPWMRYYQGMTAEDVPAAGESSNEKHFSEECLNFLPITLMDESGNKEHELLLGYYDTGSAAGGKACQTRLERISGCSNFTKEALIDDVLVIWCSAKSAKDMKVVGWYKNATVFRHYQGIPLNYEDGSCKDKPYNIIASVNDVVLLPEADRSGETWDVPRKNMKNGMPFGFYRSNIWFADEPEAKDYVEKLIEHIDGYAGKNDIYL